VIPLSPSDPNFVARPSYHKLPVEWTDTWNSALGVNCVPFVTHSTVRDLLLNQYRADREHGGLAVDASKTVPHFLIIDCRYDYEYDGASEFKFFILKANIHFQF
jgi:hypothetical protein